MQSTPSGFANSYIHLPAAARTKGGWFDRRQALVSCHIEAIPRKLGNLLKFTTDINRDVRFYTEVPGMKLSERIGDHRAAFLRCGGDSDHHTLALASSAAPELHHLSREMGKL